MFTDAAQIKNAYPTLGRPLLSNQTADRPITAKQFPAQEWREDKEIEAGKYLASHRKLISTGNKWFPIHCWDVISFLLFFLSFHLYFLADEKQLPVKIETARNTVQSRFRLLLMGSDIVSRKSMLSSVKRLAETQQRNHRLTINCSVHRGFPSYCCFRIHGQLPSGLEKEEEIVSDRW